MKIVFFIALLTLTPLSVFSASNCKEILEFIKDIPCHTELDNEVSIEKYGEKRFPPEDDWGGTRGRVSGAVKALVEVCENGTPRNIIPINYSLHIFIDEAVAIILDTELSVGKLGGKETEYLIPLIVTFDVISDDTPYIRIDTTSR